MNSAAATAESLRIACAGCLTPNRVAADRLGEQPKCGRCGALLLAGEPVELDAARFAAFIERTELPVVVDFWAPWCGPCRAMAPMFAQAARSLAGRAHFVKLNTDAEPDLAARYRVRSIPTLLLIRNGTEVRRASGALDAGALVRWVGQPEEY